MFPVLVFPNWWFLQGLEPQNPQDFGVISLYRSHADACATAAEAGHGILNGLRQPGCGKRWMNLTSLSKGYG